MKDAIVTLIVSCLLAFTAYIVYGEHSRLNKECKAKGGELISRDNICVKKL